MNNPTDIMTDPFYRPSVGVAGTHFGLPPIDLREPEKLYADDPESDAALIGGGGLPEGFEEETLDVVEDDNTAGQRVFLTKEV